LKGLIIFLLVVLLLCVSVVIGSQNDQLATVNYLIAQSTLRLSTLLAIAVAIGFSVGLLCLVTSWLSMRLQLGLVKQKLKKLRSE
jgi:putative membrane protein